MGPLNQEIVKVLSDLKNLLGRLEKIRLELLATTVLDTPHPRKQKQKKPATQAFLVLVRHVVTKHRSSRVGAMHTVF